MLDRILFWFEDNVEPVSAACALVSVASCIVILYSWVYLKCPCL